VIVTAQKEPADVKAVPVSVTAVTNETIAGAGIRIVSDAAFLAPNTVFTEFTARKVSNPRFRGIGSSPANPAITTYIDGVPVSPGYRGGSNVGSLGTEISVGTNALEEASVTTGSASAEFGNAQSGVISVQTKTGGSNYTGSFGFESDEPFGKNMSTEEGKQAARAVAIDLMATLQAACGGDLNRVKRIVKVMSLVNSTGDFTEQHLVTNGASELLGQVFGEKGVHARSAFGVAQIPLGACVEIELIAELA